MTRPNFALTTQIKTLLNSHLKLKDLGSLKFFLGIETARSEFGIIVSQCQYALQFLNDFSFLDANPVATPMNPLITLYVDSGTELTDVSHYKRLIGKLLYLTSTRPSITFFVHHLNQFLSSLRDCHLQAANHFLCFIKGQLGLGFFTLLLLPPHSVVCGLGHLSHNSSIDHRSLCFSWRVSLCLEVQEAENYFMLLCGIRILGSYLGFQRARVALAALTSIFRLFLRRCCL